MKAQYIRPFPIVAATLGLLILSSSSLQADLFGNRRDVPRPTPLPPNRFPAPLPNPYSDPLATVSEDPILVARPVAPVAQPVSLPRSEPMARSVAPVPMPRPETRSALFRKPFFAPRSYDLPFSDYQFRRSSGNRSRGFFSSDKPTEEALQLIAIIRARAETAARFGLPYKFGGDHPSEGGMDCSGTMKFLLGDIGFSDMPRTSYQQYDWLRKHRTLHHSKSIPERMGGRRGIKPGDLIFWGGTYDSGHKVSHVMVYLGQGGDGTHYMFGARGKKKRGLNGNGIDIFELSSGYQKSLVGYGSLPGV